MAGYLLDTCIIIDVLNGKRDRENLLRGLLRQGHLLACCSVNIAEVYAGVRPKEEAGTECLLRSLEYHEITWDTARKAGLMKRDYSRKGLTLSVADVMIAAVAMVHDLTLVTHNVKHYPMPGLKICPVS